MDKAAVVDRLKRKIADYDEHRLSAVRQEIGKLRRRVQELEGITAKLYEDKYSGAVSESTFMMLTQKNEQERLAKAERLDALLSKVWGPVRSQSAHNSLCGTAVFQASPDIKSGGGAACTQVSEHSPATNCAQDRAPLLFLEPLESLRVAKIQEPGR